MIRHRKWCKKGCGKKVVYNPQWLRQRKKYVCEECETRYTAKQLGLVKKNSGYVPKRNIPSIVKLIKMVNK